jgi:hypothetical protein
MRCRNATSCVPSVLAGRVAADAAVGKTISLLFLLFFDLLCSVTGGREYTELIHAGPDCRKTKGGGFH